MTKTANRICEEDAVSRDLFCSLTSGGAQVPSPRRSAAGSYAHISPCDDGTWSSLKFEVREATRHLLSRRTFLSTIVRQTPENHRDLYNRKYEAALHWRTYSRNWAPPPPPTLTSCSQIIKNESKPAHELCAEKDLSAYSRFTRTKYVHPVRAGGRRRREGLTANLDEQLWRVYDPIQQDGGRANTPRPTARCGGAR